jgi:S-DNA-T family DNA segregation ATPase FtsK/SpoIIIE
VILAEEDSQSYLGLRMGETLEGHDFLSFVSSWPHMLVGGSTNSGKTTFIRSLLLQLARLDPKFAKVVIVDGKQEVDYLNLLPVEVFTSRFPEVILGHQTVLDVLDWVVANEIPDRRKIIMELARAGTTERPRTARDLFVSSASGGQAEPFPPLFIVIDEFSEIMLSDREKAKRFEERVQQITQIGRSTLVHLLLATQRPEATVVRGAIKANLDARVALRVPTYHDSMTILGGKGAERLLGRGDLIFQSAGHPPIRLQGYRT